MKAKGFFGVELGWKGERAAVMQLKTAFSVGFGPLLHFACKISLRLFMLYFWEKSCKSVCYEAL